MPLQVGPAISAGGRQGTVAARCKRPLDATKVPRTEQGEGSGRADPLSGGRRVIET